MSSFRKRCSGEEVRDISSKRPRYFLPLVPAEAELTKSTGIEISEEGASPPAHAEINPVSSGFKCTCYEPVTVWFVRKRATSSTLKADAWNGLRGGGNRRRRGTLGCRGGVRGACFHGPRPLASLYHRLWQAKLPVCVESVVLRARLLDSLFAWTLDVRTAVVGILESPALTGTRHFTQLGILVKHLATRTLCNRQLIEVGRFSAFCGYWDADHVVPGVAGKLSRCHVLPFARIFDILALTRRGFASNLCSWRYVLWVDTCACSEVGVELIVAFPWKCHNFVYELHSAYKL